MKRNHARGFALPHRFHLAAACLLALALFPGLGVAAQEPPTGRAVIAAADEPGERLVIHMTVYEADGKTPAPGVTVYAFHTDNSGIYSDDGGNTNPRLKVTAVTDAAGRLLLETIKPASYPGSRVPAHVHLRLSREGRPTRNLEFHFSDDPFLSRGTLDAAAAVGEYSPIRPLQKDDQAVLHGYWKVKL